MPDAARPLVVRMLAWILPSEFVSRVAEPAYDDLLAAARDRSRRAIGPLPTARFVVSCLWVGVPRMFWPPRRPAAIAIVMAVATLAWLVIRARMAYGAGW